MYNEDLAKRCFNEILTYNKNLTPHEQNFYKGLAALSDQIMSLSRKLDMTIQEVNALQTQLRNRF